MKKAHSSGGGGGSQKSDILIEPPPKPKLKQGGGRGYCPREGHPSPHSPLGRPKMDPWPKMLAYMHTKWNTVRFSHSVGHLRTVGYAAQV